MSQSSIIQRTKRAIAVNAGEVQGIDPALKSGANVSHGLNKDTLNTQWRRVRFSVEEQLQIEWCWAADAVAIDHFFNGNSTMRQCTVVNAVLGSSNCCKAPSSSACNQPHSMTNVLKVIKHLQSHVLASVSFSAVRQEIDSGRPLCTHISWAAGGGHLPIITGYRDFFETLAISDPLYGYSEVDYQVFKISYQHLGHWDESYYLK